MRNWRRVQWDFAISIPRFMACIHKRGLRKTLGRLWWKPSVSIMKKSPGPGIHPVPGECVDSDFAQLLE